MNTKLENREPEIWKPVNGYETYLISSHGRVDTLSWNRSGVRRPIVQRVDKDGYLCVVFCKDGKIKNFKVHRLVGKCFIDNPQNLPEINHKYGDKKNNYYKDLEWSSRPDNIRHSYETGLKPRTTEKQLAVLRANNAKRKGMKYKTKKQ